MLYLYCIRYSEDCLEILDRNPGLCLYGASLGGGEEVIRQNEKRQTRT